MAFRFFKSPLVRKYISFLVGVGYDSSRERSLHQVLIISTIVLSLASGYTTLLGLDEYLPMPVALLVTLGVQGLLFTASWRIGATLSAARFKFSLVVIYLITIVTSVFFSYSALLDTVYDPARRVEDELDRARIVGEEIALQIADGTSKQVLARADSARTAILAWTDSVGQSAAKIRRSMEDSSQIAALRYEKLDERFQKEKSEGGTLVATSGVSQTTGPGYGKYAKQYEQERDEYEATRVVPVRGVLDKLARAEDQLVAAAGSFVGSSSAFTEAGIRRLYSASHDLETIIASLDVGSQKDFAFPPALARLVGAAGAGNQFLNWYSSDFDIDGSTTTEQLKRDLVSLVEHEPYLSASDRTRYFNRVASIGELQGADVHYFALAIGEIRSGNLLAIGSLLIAIVIDLLILFCGVLGARPDSYLDMTQPDQLSDVKELALETVLSLDLTEEMPAGSTNGKYVARIAEILRHARPEVDLAHDGIPVSISKADITSMGLAKEVGILMSLGLAHQLEDGSLGLRTRLVLWMANQVVNSREKVDTEEGFEQSFGREML